MKRCRLIPLPRSIKLAVAASNYTASSTANGRTVSAAGAAMVGNISVLWRRAMEYRLLRYSSDDHVPIAQRRLRSETTSFSADLYASMQRSFRRVFAPSNRARLLRRAQYESDTRWRS